MRNVTILLAAVAMLALTVPAYGVVITWDGNTDGDGDGVNWHDPYNWAGDVLPTGTDDARVTNGDTVHISVNTNTKYVTFGRGIAHGILKPGGQINYGGYNYFRIGLVTLQTGAAATFTQEAGSGIVKASVFEIGGTFNENQGHGMYTIQGRAAGAAKMIDAGDMFLGYYSSSYPTTGKGTFVIDCSGVAGSGPDDTDIYGATYIQTVKSKLWIMLDAAGDVGQVNVSGTATLSGTLELTVGTFVGTPNVTKIDVLSAGTLDYYDTTPGDRLSIDATSYAAGWRLTDDGSGTLQVELIPEPATMVLLGLGGIGVLIRRKRR